MQTVTCALAMSAIRSSSVPPMRRHEQAILPCPSSGSRFDGEAMSMSQCWFCGKPSAMS
jgi:hypothetical protein